VAEKAMPKMSIDSHEAATGELHRVRAGFGDRFFLDAMPGEDVAEFGKDYPLGRTAQPAELAPPYVMLASDEASYISGATIAVTGAKPMM
jgi:NAD(P)-dependent dehydrogenase (short-subunit alcohol dehydrogenase family)